MQVYFYRMGIKYLKILREDDPTINRCKTKCLFILMTLILFLSGIHIFLIYAIIVI